MDQTLDDDCCSEQSKIAWIESPAYNPSATIWIDDILPNESGLVNSNKA